jgi:maltooligosyltrehalose synthase
MIRASAARATLSPADGRQALSDFTVLNFRRRNLSLLNRGNYVPLSISGEKVNHVCAFAGPWLQTIIVVVHFRSDSRMEEIWPLGSETWQLCEVAHEIAAGVLQNLFTGER